MDIELIVVYTPTKRGDWDKDGDGERASGPEGHFLMGTTPLLRMALGSMPALWAATTPTASQ